MSHTELWKLYRIGGLKMAFWTKSNLCWWRCCWKGPTICGKAILFTPYGKWYGQFSVYLELSWHMISQFHFWVYHQGRKESFKRIYAHDFPFQFSVQYLRDWNQPRCPLTDEWLWRCGIYSQWNTMQLQEMMESYNLLLLDWKWKTPCWVK